ncbi:MAG: (2Fe-2S)-binding protein [Chloroflexi bacterium]|nr:MAG: (2Fe-2S)-binding protein [Chloroflexota bacterium]
MVEITLKVNGEKHRITVMPYETLCDVLRNRLGHTEVKNGCNKGECGACTVLVDGKLVCSCLTLAVRANGKEITTVKGLSADGELHPLQKSFIEHGAIQCGYCTPGMLLAAKALLDRNPRPNEAEVRAAISGNICRCTGYQQIVEAIMAASEEISKQK